jgi:DNA-binding response OmpR family regulator
MAELVMVVEDDANIGALVRTYLERDGFGVLWVRSGESALTELKTPLTSIRGYGEALSDGALGPARSP